MKILSFTFLIWVLLTSVTYGQKNKLILGGQYSYGLSTLRGNETISKYNYTTFGDSYGLFTLFGFSNTFSLHLCFNFEHKGSEVKLPAYDPNSQQQVEYVGTEKFDYFTIPLSLRMSFGRKYRCFIDLGPSIGFLLKQQEHFESTLGAPEINQDKTDSYKKTETGVTFCVGISRLFIEKYFLSIYVNDHLGLTNTSKYSGKGGGGIKTNLLTLGISIGYCLNHKTK